MEITLETVSAETFKNILKHDLETFENDPNFRLNCLTLAGSEERAIRFLEAPGVGIGEFSRLMGLPVSSVRHYIRLGLVEPFVVNSEFKFQYWNPAQVESVRWWSDLGFTLEDILQRKLEARAKKPGLKLRDVVQVRVGDYEGVGIALLSWNRIEQDFLSESGLWVLDEGPQDPLPAFPTGNTTHEQTLEMNAISAELPEDYRAARTKLEVRKREIESRIARTLEIEQKFAASLD